ncbi:hypothetical protein [Fusobacterium nucleatum]|uniref:hypothetical protein n=1 Tax=Fusobacterium nucleatum TaxID=851 RepID=UPI0004246E29|nr:hypothetical protein [Fusobacterium nucleatum]
MAKYTEYLRLVKPEGNEYYNVEQFNQNSELIDKETKKLSEGLAKVQEGATKDKKGIVQFGTEEGKALEGMMLARLAGCVGYGGDIQEPGVKDINYIYYDRNTRKMYKCLNQNSDVSANVANFIPLDNNSLLDRLENLNKHLQYVIKYNKSIVFQKNDVGATLTADRLGVRIPKNRNILVIATGSTGNNSYAIGIFPNSEKNVSENCGFSFYPQSTSRITCSYVLDNTDTIYVRALTTKAPHTHPQYIINYLDKPENDIIVNCILLD